MIPLPSDSWLWILDDELVRTLFAVSPGHSGLAARAAAEPALVAAVRHWLRAEPQAALSALEPALAREDADALLLGAQLSFETGDLARAASLYHRLAECVPDHPYAAFNEGLCQLRLKQWQAAAEALQRAVVLTPSHAEAWHLLGASLLHLDRYAEAASAFGQCLSLRPGYVPAICGKAAALQLQGKPAEALALYLPLVEAAPEREEILMNALGAALDAADWPQVRRLALRVAAVSPGSLPAKEALAHADLSEQKWEDALGGFRELSALAPAFLEPWYHTGVCLFRLGRYAEAAEAFQSALQIDSRHVESRLALAEYLEPTTSYLSMVELGLYDSSLKLFNGLVERGVKPDSAEWAREVEAALAHHRKAMAPRLFPPIPDSRYLCFYPMDRKRGGKDNWYALPIEERRRLMHEHGMTGRRWAGEVQQIITGSVGFDDWEWGVDLFADDPLVFKKLIYEMRYDEVSARFALFGPFYVGLRVRAPQLAALLSGRL